MTMDPENPIVKLCVEGMRAEAGGRFDEARAIFTRAWEQSRDDFEACIAAHYLARHQDSPQDNLRWNQAALDRAGSVCDEKVRGFYPSLYLNVGFSYEMLGDLAEARRHYELAAERVTELPEGPYTDLVRHGIEEGRKRTSLQSLDYNLTDDR
jgi:tetratricopeptide (TPR) repeat protein